MVNEKVLFIKYILREIYDFQIERSISNCQCNNKTNKQFSEKKIINLIVVLNQISKISTY